MAPEVMRAEQYDEKADIFSFGVLLSELDTHALPYSHTGLAYVYLFKQIADGNAKVQFSSGPESEAAGLGRRASQLIRPADRQQLRQSMCCTSCYEAAPPGGAVGHEQE